MAKNNKKIYVLEICYDTEQGEIEYIEEFVTSVSDNPTLIPFPDKVEVDDEYWDVDTNIIGES
jgi:hypothetical protein